jgi:hypothetical protein
MPRPSKSAPRLAALIKKAIKDHQITNAEYEEIIAVAEEDKAIDREEAALLRELQHLIANGTVTRVP